MVEQNPYSPDEARFSAIDESRFYQFGTEIQLPGDPDNPTDFARAQHYLETITAHLLEFGPVWEKAPNDIIIELHHHNAWHQYEVEQERKAGEKRAEYRAITIQQLRALSRRRLLAFEETGWEVTHAYRIVNYIDALIAEAVAEQEAFEQFPASSQESEDPLPASPNLSAELPF